jgi:hypothetical protein
VAGYLGVNIGLILYDFPFAHFARDWAVWESLASGLATGGLYRAGTELPYLLSPVAAPVMAVQGLVGPAASVAAHIVAVLLLRDPRAALIVVGSWGFWTDMAGGNTLVYALVAGLLAVRGSRPAGLAFIVIVLLAPRPVELPLAAWLMWTQPGLRVPAGALVVAHALAVWLTGYADAWITTLMSLGIPAWSIGPSHWVGAAWLVVGIPAAILLTIRARPGWAGLLLSPYWVPQYFLMPLVDLLPRRRSRADRSTARVPVPNPDPVQA